MPKCPKCNKEVYFAERKTSLGKDWHAACLRCTECNKVLQPGGHAESVAAWLAAAGLNHLQGALIDNGYDALDVVAEMHDKDMNACGIYDTGDRAALALAIQRLRTSRSS